MKVKRTNLFKTRESRKIVEFPWTTCYQIQNSDTYNPPSHIILWRKIWRYRQQSSQYYWRAPTASQSPGWRWTCRPARPGPGPGEHTTIQTFSNFPSDDSKGKTLPDRLDSSKRLLNYFPFEKKPTVMLRNKLYGIKMLWEYRSAEVLNTIVCGKILITCWVFVVNRICKWSQYEAGPPPKTDLKIPIYIF